MFSWVSLLVFSGGGWEKKRKQAARSISGSSNSHCSLLPICFYFQELRGTIEFAVLSGVFGRHENQNKAHVGLETKHGWTLSKPQHRVWSWSLSGIRTDRCLKCATLWLRIWKHMCFESRKQMTRIVWRWAEEKMDKVKCGSGNYNKYFD